MALQFWGLSVGLTTRPRKKHSVKKPSKKPRNWIENGKQLESENGLRIGTWNVRTLNKPGALQYVLDAYNNYTIDILAVQEIRWPNNGNLKKGNITLFYSGTSNGKHENGVGFMIHDKILPNVKTFSAFNDRICYIHIAGKILDLIIINCYAPTEEKDEDIKDKFYEELESVYDTLPLHCIKIVVGDMNAKVGRENMYRPVIGPNSLHEISNGNGTRLVNFAHSKNCIISSTYFPRKNIHKFTWKSPDGGTFNQIDHILINRRFSGCIRNVRTYRGADADSDHYLVYAKFNLRLATKWNLKKKKPTVKYDIQKLNDIEINDNYVEKIAHKLQNININQISYSTETDTIWNRTKEAVVNSATEILGMKPKESNKNWFNDICKNAIIRRNELRKKALQDTSDKCIREYEDQRKLTNKTLRKEKRLHEKKKIEEIEINRYNAKKFFKMTGEVKVGFKPQTRILVDSAGTMITEEKQVISQFKEHFEDLLNRPTTGHNLNPNEDCQTAEIVIDTPKYEEIENLIKRLKNNKAPGENSIVAELLKKGGTMLVSQITEVIKTIWKTETIPEEWKTAIVCPIFKKGNPTKTENYRGISLLDTCYKILTTLILERINPYVEEIVGSYQCGFRRGKSTTDHVFALRQIMSKYYEFGKDLHLVFVDYKQAYDSVDREELWKALVILGIPKKYVNLIKACYEKTLCRVRYLQGISDPFEVKSGLKQGDALSPALFNLALEKIIRDTNDDRRMEISNEQVMLAYADDIVVMGETKEEIINSTSKLINASKGIGLHVNEGKTKYMVVSRRPPNIDSIEVDNYKFEKVDNFKYLGVNINNKNDMHIEINERITSGNRCYFSIIKLLRSKLLSRGSKILLYHSYLRPVITYACETWSLTKGDSRRLITLERKVLRTIYGSIFNPETQTYERRSNENVKSLYNKPNILSFIRKKRLEWFGHAWRADGQLIKNVIIKKINKTRPLGRPKTRWIDVVAKDIVMINQNATFETAYQRDRWREILMAAMVLNGPLS